MKKSLNSLCLWHSNHRPIGGALTGYFCPILSHHILSLPKIYMEKRTVFGHRSFGAYALLRPLGAHNKQMKNNNNYKTKYNNNNNRKKNKYFTTTDNN